MFAPFLRPHRSSPPPERFFHQRRHIPTIITAIQSSGLGASSPRLEQDRYKCKVFAVTDLHVDYPANLDWCRKISGSKHRHDVLIVAGDVSDVLPLLEEALGELVSKFGWVLYVPGNHELWLRQQDAGLQHSVQKLDAVLEICARLGVHTTPQRIGSGLWVVPMLSWHHRSFDQEPDVPGVPPVSRMTIADYAACRWPHGLGDGLGGVELAQWFDAQNDSACWEEVLSSRQQCDVISFSHFLPSQALVPEKRFLFYPNLPKAVGSLPLGARVKRLQPDIHIFGHTHFAWDASLDGVRYIQAPLCSPLERQRRLFTVSFESTMEQAKADPEAAAWLPLQVYECTLTRAELPPSSSSSGVAERSSSCSGLSRGSTGSGSWEAAGSAAGGMQLGGGEGIGGGEEEIDGEVVESIDHAMHGIAIDPEEETLDYKLPEDAAVREEGASSRSAPLSALPQAAALSAASSGRGHSEGTVAAAASTGSGLGTAGSAALADGRHGGTAESAPGPEGALRLRHGWMPGNLGAHWSEYYTAHPRTPENLTLAPWVAKVYERRRTRTAQANKRAPTVA